MRTTSKGSIPQLEWTERFFIGQLSNWLARRTVNAIPLGV